MAKVSLTSLTAFDEPLTYHQGATTFLAYHASEVVRRAQPVIAEIQRCHPGSAQAFSQVVTAFSQRLFDESNGHAGAVTYLTSNRSALATVEAKLSGTLPPTFDAPSAGDALDWAVPDHTATKGVVGEFRQLMSSVQHKLYELDSGLRSLDPILLNLKHNPPFPLNQTPGIEGLIQDVHDALNKLREMYEKLFVPSIDGEVAQPYIDYLKGVQSAYHAHVMQPFDSVTTTFLASYTPPPHMRQYQQSLSEAPGDQQKTYVAMNALISQLQLSVDHSENMVALQMTLLTALLAAVVLVTALVVSGGLSIEISGPGLVAIGIGSFDLTSAIGAAWAAFVGALETLGAVEIPTWVWTMAAGTATIGTILTIPSDTSTATIHMTENTRDTGIMADVWKELGSGANRDDICRKLAQMWDEAKFNPVRRLKIKATQKYYGCRRSSQS
jgi:hypothetical protein